MNVVVLPHLANAFPHPWEEACFWFILWILLSCFHNSRGEIILALYKVYKTIPFLLLSPPLPRPVMWACEHPGVQCSHINYFLWMPIHYRHSPPGTRTKSLYAAKGWAFWGGRFRGAFWGFFFMAQSAQGCCLLLVWGSVYSCQRRDEKSYKIQKTCFLAFKFIKDSSMGRPRPSTLNLDRPETLLQAE